MNINCLFIWGLAKYSISWPPQQLGVANGGLTSGGRFVQLEVFAPSGGGNDATAVKRAFAFIGIAFVELASAAILLSGVSWITGFVYVFGLQFETHRLRVWVCFRESFTRCCSFHFLFGCGYLRGESSACECDWMHQKDASIWFVHLDIKVRVNEVSEPIAQSATLRDGLTQHQRSQNPWWTHADRSHWRCVCNGSKKHQGESWGTIPTWRVDCGSAVLQWKPNLWDEVASSHWSRQYFADSARWQYWQPENTSWLQLYRRIADLPKFVQSHIFATASVLGNQRPNLVHLPECAKECQ